MLRRLGIFAGGFGLDAAVHVAADQGVTTADVVESVANLVAKSLVTAELDGVGTRYRLLETTRAYALGKLGESDEAEWAAPPRRVFPEPSRIACTRVRATGLS